MNLFVVDINIHVMELDINMCEMVMCEKVLLQQGMHFYSSI